MDKVLSARVDESVIKKIGTLAVTLRMTKKAVIEAAIRAYSEKAEKGQVTDPLEQTLGAWKRDETPDETVMCGKSTFRTAMERYRR